MTPPAESDWEVVRLPLAKLEPDPALPDRLTTNAAIEKLALQIQQSGILRPLVVRRSPEREAVWYVVTGRRIWLALDHLYFHNDKARWAEAPCIVREMTTIEALEAAHADNEGQARLSPIELVWFSARVVEEEGRVQDRGKQARAAARLGVTPARITQRMKVARVFTEEALYYGSDAVPEEGLLAQSEAEFRRLLKEEDPLLALRRLLGLEPPGRPALELLSAPPPEPPSAPPALVLTPPPTLHQLGLEPPPTRPWTSPAQVEMVFSPTLVQRIRETVERWVKNVKRVYRSWRLERARPAPG